ncbi:Rieske (2Fe-2S) protein [Allorhizocola rhizosphaerae]|uniref:Rieske (2Fe-2S) protein n=1 Tax=Allorhizocola rhizosphaerae TaxID=1872709 RepID=UPI000E3D24B0|nr:Rieske (2Fe-2S) protein [Allorhizocola rhizosphaerae]
MTDQHESPTSRRALIAGASAIGAASLIAACGGNETPSTTPTTGGNPQPTPTTAGGASATLAKKSDIPVGGGKIFGEQGVVVTQPTAGTFRGFDNICTHQGCPVSKVENEAIVCTCHNSRFSIADGSVRGGQATKPLPEKALKIDGDEISLG